MSVPVSGNQSFTFGQEDPVTVSYRLNYNFSEAFYVPFLESSFIFQSHGKVRQFLETFLAQSQGISYESGNLCQSKCLPKSLKGTVPQHFQSYSKINHLGKIKTFPISEKYFNVIIYFNSFKNVIMPQRKEGLEEVSEFSF